MVLKAVSLFFIASILLVSCSNQSEELSDEATEKIDVKYLFTLKCASCHGSDGKLGAAGAKDLSSSILTDIELKKILTEGKNGMPSFGSSLSSEEQNEIIKFVKTLRK